MIPIRLFFYRDNVRVINKNISNLQISTGGRFYKDEDTLNPVFLIKETNFTKISFCNYCYIPLLNKYYFVNKKEIMTTDTFKLYLKEDVLCTFSSFIRSHLKATVIEQNAPNAYISTRQTVYNTKPNFVKINFPNLELFNKEGNIIMVTIKGNI